ncbi:G-protein coupled receptor 4-like [Polyodon spathula]|uniref:G-protein coupled receptor 4-like n=1 Tax=Polyodon spathula TaxID=7913 RepID=UPI001B7EC8FF|nr:G-protein coupled receptor 4-like [Polyodon spathula]
MNNFSICNESCDNIDFSLDQTFLPALYALIFCIGLPTNCLALYGLYCLVRTDNTLPVYIINLLLSDLLHITMLPLWIDYYSRGHVWRFGDALCSSTGIIFWISQIVSIFFMLCVALERYIAVSHPLWFRSQRRLKYTCLLCGFAWLVAFLGITISFKVGFTNTADGLCFEKYPSNKQYCVLRLGTITLGFPLPLTLLVGLYGATWRNINQAVSVADCEKKKITKLLLLLVVIFVLVFGPYHIVGYVRYTGLMVLEDCCDYEARIFIYFQIGMGFLSLSSLLDPFLYIFVCRDVRKEMLDSFPCFQKLANVTERWKTARASTT